MKDRIAVAQASSGEVALPPRVQEALGQLVGSAKEGLLALERRRRARRARRADGRGGRRGRRPEGQARPGADRGPARPRVGRGDARRPTRRRWSGRACAAPTAQRRCRLQTYEHFADRDPLTQVGAGADARRRLDAPLPAHAGAGRRAGRAGGAVDVEVVGLAHLHRAHPPRARRADEPPPRRRPAGGDDDRRARAAGTHQRRRARDHDRGREDPARALGREHRERDRRDRAARPTWSSAASTPSRGSCS